MMRSMEFDDRTVVRRALDGDQSAFAELLNVYRDRIFSFILRFTSSPADAEDLAQETFLKAFTRLKSYDPNRSFLTWLFRIAHNTAVDHLRSTRLSALALDEDVGAYEVAASEPTPEQNAFTSIEEGMIEELLMSLPPLYREIVLLRYKEEMDIAEIAEAVGLPVGTVKVRLFRARAQLQTRLDGIPG